jgi:hypothetical protein
MYKTEEEWVTSLSGEVRYADREDRHVTDVECGRFRSSLRAAKAREFTCVDDPVDSPPAVLYKPHSSLEDNASQMLARLAGHGFLQSSPASMAFGTLVLSQAAGGPLTEI